jgi:hypothetical protein
MPANLEQARETMARVHHARDGGALTQEVFVTAYLELEQALGDGVEADGIESLANLAEDDSWIEAAEAASRARARSSA